MKNFLIRLITATVILFSVFGILIYTPNWIFSFFLLISLFIILTIEWPRLLKIKNLFYYWFITFIYPMFPFIIMILFQYFDRKILNILLFSSVFAFDTGSYIFGKLFGRHQILPKISPKKTWEGFIGGYFSTCFILYFFLTRMNIFMLFSLTFVVCVLALAGDLFESYLKRKSGIKDSSSILPGHGGLLDRYDGILFAVILFFILQNYLLFYLR